MPFHGPLDFFDRRWLPLPSKMSNSPVIRFGRRLRAAELLDSMGRVASVDYTMMEWFWSSMQRELLGRRSWASRKELAPAISEWIEGSDNPH